MTTQHAKIEIPDTIAAELEHLRSLVCSQPLVRQAYGFLTEPQQKAFDEDSDACRNFAGFWSKAHGISFTRAVLDIAVEMDLLSTPRHAKLLKALGEPVASTLSIGPVPEAAMRPRWDRERGLLLLGGKQLGKFRIGKIKSQLQMILDAFEQARWPTSILQPVQGADQKTVHERLYRLNKKLKQLSFHAHQGTQHLSWELKPARVTRKAR